MISVLAQAARPTALAIAWGPVVGASTGLLLISLALAGVEQAGGVLPALGAAMVAFAVVSSLHDPASHLLASVPTPLMARRLLRVAIVAPAAVGALLLARPGEPLLVLGDAAALALAGLAVNTWVPGGRGVSLGAAVPLAWVGAAQFVGGRSVLMGEALLWWNAESLVVAAVAVAFVLLGGRR